MKNFFIIAACALGLSLVFALNAHRLNAQELCPTPLSVGSSGSDVKALQNFLEAQHYLNLPEGVIKGYFGMMTRNALMSYQRMKNISAVGVCGPKTKAQLSVDATGFIGAENVHLDHGSALKDTLPLGDGKYTTTGPQKGYIYLCNARTNEGEGGAGKDGPWITGGTWNPSKKISVTGNVMWNNAKFSLSQDGTERIITGNGLPTTHGTGVFPVGSSDAAYAYDRNPNSIKAQTLELRLPTTPVALATPECMGGEVGIMLSGVPLFNGFDAQLRDAVAHEVQDSCDGHPQMAGQYHYHSLSDCSKDMSVETVLGYALDGYPITGPKLSDGTYLFTDDLDACHGMTSEIMVDGIRTKSYHYVMTQDFPYSVGCFMAHPVQKMIMKNTGMGQGMPPQGGMGAGMMPPPRYPY